jgi:hypothetical protein
LRFVEVLLLKTLFLMTVVEVHFVICFGYEQIVLPKS